MLLADQELGAEVYSAATTRDLAKIVFGDARTMALRDKGMQAAFGLNIQQHVMTVNGTGSVFKPLASEGEVNDGLNIHLAVVDELHAHPTRDLYDVLATGVGKRNKSLLWVISTAGSNIAGVCYEQHLYAVVLVWCGRVSTEQLLPRR